MLVVQLPIVILEDILSHALIDASDDHDRHRQASITNLLLVNRSFKEIVERLIWEDARAGPSSQQRLARHLASTTDEENSRNSAVFGA